MSIKIEELPLLETVKETDLIIVRDPITHIDHKANPSGLMRNVFKLCNPPGSMKEYISATLPTDGYWLFANGETIGNVGSGADYENEDYEALFNKVKEAWGNAGTEVFADGDTVKLPDMIGASPTGAGTSVGYTQNETLVLGTKYDDTLQGHRQKLAYSVASVVSGATNTAFIGTNNTGGAMGENSSTNVYAGTPYSDGTNGTPRISNVTKGKQVGVNFIIAY